MTIGSIGVTNGGDGGRGGVTNGGDESGGCDEWGEGG